MRLALLTLFTMSGCNCGPGLSSALPDIQVIPLSVNFGSRASGTLTTMTVEVTNSGAAPLALNRVALEGDARAAFAVGMAPSTLASGESFTLSVVYSAPLAEGPDGATLLIESNARTSPEVRVSIAGRSVTGGRDAGADAGGVPDAGAMDAGLDAGAMDAGLTDAGAVDSGVEPFDAGPPPTDGGCWAPIPSGSQSVTYQVDHAHAGAQPNDQLRLPLCRRWRRDLGGAAGYPVVAGGRVFVATHTNQAGYGTLLWALEQTTGAVAWGPVNLGGTYWWAAVAYDAGKVFAVNADGFLRAVDAATGTVLWGVQLPGQRSCDSAPTATNSMVYVGAAGSGGTVYALWASNGGVRWSMPVANGQTSSPAVSSNGVFVSYACNQAWGFSPSGAQLWHHSGTCSGGGGKNVALFRGRVFTRDIVTGHLVLDAATGLEQGTHASRLIPSFLGDLMVSTASTVSGSSVATGALTWTFDAGGEFISTAPIIVGAHVIAASATRLLAINAADGTLASSFAVSGVRGTDEQNVSDPLAGFAAADGMVFVPVGNGLEAY